MIWLSVESTFCTRQVLQKLKRQFIIGTPAFKLQRSASNTTFTIYLLHSSLEVDFVNIVEGASNGNELLIFFEEAVEITKRDGSVLLERCDTVIMDNCPFHHGRFMERALE